jgi:ribosomal protein S24E
MENYKLVSEFKNGLFNRVELEFTLESKTSPNHEDIEKFISEKFKTIPEKIKIKRIKGKFGSNLFSIEANIYDSADEKEATEKKKKWEIEKEKKIQEAKKDKKEESKE